MEASGDLWGAQLLRAWLSALSPPSELWKIFNPPGMASAAADAGRDTTHLQQFAEVLRAFAEIHSAEQNKPLEMADTVLALLANLQRQLSVLRKTLHADALPAITWLEAQTHPILGPAREAHGRWATLARAGLTHARAQCALQETHFEMLHEALTRCGDLLRSDQGPALKSVRALYDFWVRCADTTYRELALAAAYATQFAAIVDSGSGMRAAWQRWQASNSELLNFAPSGTAPRATVPQGGTNVQGDTNAAPVSKKPPAKPARKVAEVRPPRKSAPIRAPKRTTSLEFDIAKIVRPPKR